MRPRRLLLSVLLVAAMAALPAAVLLATALPASAAEAGVAPMAVAPAAAFAPGWAPADSTVQQTVQTDPRSLSFEQVNTDKLIGLAWSISAGAPVEQPSVVACRYVRHCPP